MPTYLWPYITTWEDTTTWPERQRLASTEFPTVTLEAAFGVDAADVPASGDWVDVSDRLIEFEVTRGRSHELDRMEVGRATILIDNKDRRFDPTEQSDVRPMLQMRLTASTDAYTHRLFTGYVETLPQELSKNKGLHRVDLDLVDGMVALQLASISASNIDPAEESSGDRIGRILDAAGWPASLRDIDTGQSMVQAKVYDESALSAIREVAETEQGEFYITGDGVATFRGRHYRTLNQADVSAIFSDDGANDAYKYSGIEPTFDESQLWNRVVVSADGLSDQTAEDADSISRHFRRKKSVTTLTVDINEMQALADWLIWRYKEARLRFERLSLKPQGEPAVFDTALGSEFGDRFTVRLTPQSGAQIEQDVHVERLRVSGKPKLIEVAWGLSPAARDDFWVLGDDTLSILGSTTRLSF